MKKYTREERIVVWGLIIIFNLFAAIVISTKDVSLFNIEASAVEMQEGINYDIPAEEPAYKPTLNIPLSEDFQHLIYDRCQDMGMSFPLCIAIMDAESDFRPYVVSYTGVARGLMQINYDNDEWLISQYGFTDLDEPEQNVVAGIIIYQSYLERFGSVEKALMAYNMGPSKAAKFWAEDIIASEYSREVLAAAEKYEQEIAYNMTDYYMDY